MDLNLELMKPFMVLSKLIYCNFLVFFFFFVTSCPDGIYLLARRKEALEQGVEYVES